MTLSEYVPQILLALSIQFMGIISPGPSVMLILGVAANKGRAASVTTAFGVACGSVILATATVLGIAALFAEMASAMTVLRWIGALYLIWLGCKALKSAWNNHPLPQAKEAPTDLYKAALAGFLLQVTNPKAVGFWLAIAAVGGAGEAPWPILVLFVFGAFLNSFLGHGAYALILSSPSTRSVYARFRRWVDGTLGALFIAAGVRLAAGK